jgi:hypothetical protein
LLRATVGSPLGVQISPVELFVWSMVLDGFTLFAAWLAYRQGAGIYRRNALLLIAFSLASLLLNVIDLLFFDMQLSHMPVVRPVLLTLAGIEAVILLINTVFLIKHSAWPRLQGALKWGTYGVAVQYLILLASFVLFEVATYSYGPALVEQHKEFVHTSLGIIIGIVVIIWFFVLLATVILLLVGGIDYLVKRAQRRTGNKA